MSDNDDAKASVRNALAAELRGGTALALAPSFSLARSNDALAAELRAAKLRVKRASHRLVFVSSPAGKRLEVLSF